MNLIINNEYRIWDATATDKMRESLTFVEIKDGVATATDGFGLARVPVTTEFEGLIKGEYFKKAYKYKNKNEYIMNFPEKGKVQFGVGTFDALNDDINFPEWEPVLPDCFVDEVPIRIDFNILTRFANAINYATAKQIRRLDIRSCGKKSSPKATPMIVARPYNSELKPGVSFSEWFQLPYAVIMPIIQ